MDVTKTPEGAIRSARSRSPAASDFGGLSLRMWRGISLDEIGDRLRLILDHVA